MKDQGHTMQHAPSLQTQWIWKRPLVWPLWYAQTRKTQKACRRQKTESTPDIWLTYHSYYKAPDVLGPLAAKCGVPYAIFAGAYAEKRRKPWNTKAGYLLNKRALLSAHHVFSNKKRDIEPLLRILPHNRVSFIPPGIRTEKFCFNAEARQKLREQWLAKGKTIVLTVAALREGTKSEGVEQVIAACTQLASRHPDLLLVVAGDGPRRTHLETLAKHALGDNIRFLGFIDRWKLHQVYSAADIFTFPGINEGLGMVYLEAQCAGLPVVAWDHDGAPEVVEHQKTGLITPSYDQQAYVHAIEKLMQNIPLRNTLGEAAQKHVMGTHDVQKNYAQVEKTLCALHAAEPTISGRKKV